MYMYKYMWNFYAGMKKIKEDNYCFFIFPLTYSNHFFFKIQFFTFSFLHNGSGACMISLNSKKNNHFNDGNIKIITGFNTYFLLKIIQ